MSSYRRAIAHADMDALARSRGMRSAAEYLEHLQLHRRLDTGGRITAQDIEQARSRGPHVPLEAFNRLADYVNGGRTARDRADRYCDAVARGIGAPEHQLASIREQARSQAESLAVQDFAAPLTRQLNERDQQRDRANGIDQRERVVEAQRAAMTNPDAIRRADIEREVNRHAGSQPTLYAHDRRELIAQQADRNVERIRDHMVRDADRERRPDRSDDRVADIGLAIDCLSVNDLANDELSIAANPLLESVDNALTHAESMERE